MGHETHTRTTAAIVGAAGAAAAVVTWYLVGDLSSPGPGTPIVAAPQVPVALEHVGGVLAIGLLVALAAVTARRTGATGIGAAALLVPAGVLLGGIGRLVTAATPDANIGGGIAILFGLPLVGTLVLAAVAVLVTSAVRRRRTAGART
ncbi:hypothetical protein [Pseudonocardia sp. HH130630-07]|uniref:hypothetical protein n=1 Tax=Pseudonocardia sp. HH130630-07 TaxID=1690815 RepID=UPI000814D59B|nr:hypothetical protein [Pseudonocardia sp. HH130630-07]ANY05576.1 hypothetical protein AFB00_03810 [Pseudonocardia sp. HH130630-07]